ncbi:MAG: septum formation protein Maf [Pseudooceanicola sp.]|nr:septum formation protein Maf [Pseudooceanicola sp.]
MAVPLILASGSAIRADLLRRAGLDFTIQVPRVDEDTVRRSLEASQATARDIADALAEMKARRIADKNPAGMVLGCDQVLDLGGAILAKPESPEQAVEQLTAMQGRPHQLLSAAVLYEDARPVWRHVGVVRMQMRALSPGFIKGYVARNWDSVRHSVGAYKLEEEGVRLFSKIDGDVFSILGMPLIEFLNYLDTRGLLDT